MDTAATYEARQALVLKLSQSYFPSVREDNFRNLFKLSLSAVVCLTKDRKKPKHLRNFLMMLFHLKHYLPIRTACIMFDLENSRYEQIVNLEIRDFVESHQSDYFQTHTRELRNELENFPNTFMIVDSTEVLIEASQKNTFSGKKHNFTVKYQLLVGSLTGEILHVYGPSAGAVHDATIWKNSKVEEFLQDHDEYVLGDKGYVGCVRVIHPFKKKRNPLTQEKIPLTPHERDFNHKISKHRYLIENVNSWIKDWSIVSTVYRGDLEIHSTIFLACCILTTMASEDFIF